MLATGAPSSTGVRPPTLAVAERIENVTMPGAFVVARRRTRVTPSAAAPTTSRDSAARWLASLSTRPAAVMTVASGSSAISESDSASETTMLKSPSETPVAVVPCTVTRTRIRHFADGSGGTVSAYGAPTTALDVKSVQLLPLSVLSDSVANASAGTFAAVNATLTFDPIVHRSPPRGVSRRIDGTFTFVVTATGIVAAGYTPTL